MLNVGQKYVSYLMNITVSNVLNLSLSSRLTRDNAQTYITPLSLR